MQKAKTTTSCGAFVRVSPTGVDDDEEDDGDGDDGDDDKGW